MGGTSGGEPGPPYVLAWSRAALLPQSGQPYLAITPGKATPRGAYVFETPSSPDLSGGELGRLRRLLHS